MHEPIARRTCSPRRPGGRTTRRAPRPDAGLDSPELEAWAADALVPVDADGLGDLMTGLHVVSVLLLDELHEATEKPPAAVLQRRCISRCRSWRSARLLRTKGLRT
jgi:hypothetical protein